jgi:hypothetical protein
MKIELKKKTGMLGEVDYFIYINESAVACLSNEDEANKAYEAYVKNAKNPIYETLQSIEI